MVIARQSSNDALLLSTTLVKELRLDGVTSKSWVTQDGKIRKGKPIDKGLIYKLLNNRTYLGELRHKELSRIHQPSILRSPRCDTKSPVIMGSWNGKNAGLFGSNPNAPLTSRVARFASAMLTGAAIGSQKAKRNQ